MRIFKPINDSENLVIFIHGFTGSKDTWLKIDDTPKPLISFLLEDDYLCKKFHYAIYEYSTSIRSNGSRLTRLIKEYLSGQESKRSLSIKDVANNLKTQIGDRFNNYKRIIIIGHSMGGLVGKQVINEILNENKKSKIELFITLATPHLGESLASTANLFFQNPQIEDLQLLSTSIYSLTDSWIKKINLPKRVYFTAQYDDVVKVGSAGLESNHVTTKDTFSSHSSIINPSNASDDVVVSLKKVLIDFFKSHEAIDSENVDKIKVFFSRGTPHTDKQEFYLKNLKYKLDKYNIELVLSWSPTDPIKKIREHMNEFNGCLVLGMERTYLKEGIEKRGSDDEQNISNQILPALWLQLEAAMACQMELPLLIFREKTLKQEGMFDSNNHGYRVIDINIDKPNEIDGEFIDRCIESWIHQVKEYKNRR